MNDPKRPSDLPNSGFTTGDLRKQAEDAVRRLRNRESPAPGMPQGTTDLDPSLPSESLESTTNDLADAASAALQQVAPVSAAIPMSVPTGTQDFSDAMILRFDVAEGTAPLMVERILPEMVMGRSDTATNYTPEVDLTRYGAYRLGLSRRHAILRRQGASLYLMDLGGRNGTALNGHRLEANQSCLISSGDEITLGNLKMRVTFQTR